MDLFELEQLDKSLYEEGQECPRCGDGKLVLRYARRFNGEEFLGCSDYPKCEFTFDL